MTNIPAVVNPRAPKRMVGCELLNLAAHNPADLVQLSEQQYQSRIDAAAAYVLASGRRIVMLTGPSAAGKTTSANKLAAAMRSKGVRSRVSQIMRTGFLPPSIRQVSRGLSASTVPMPVIIAE